MKIVSGNTVKNALRTQRGRLATQEGVAVRTGKSDSGPGCIHGEGICCYKLSGFSYISCSDT